jgi:drug/metabolite transporter (DMT)-like permease
MIYLPILGAVGLASATILQRVVLKKKHISIKQFQILEFLAIVLAMIPFVFFFWRVDSQALLLKNILVFLGVVIISVFANIFVYYGLKKEKVNNLQPARMMEPLFVVILAILFSFIISSELYENNLNVIIPSIIAGLALVFSHIKKNQLKFNRYFIAAIIGSFLFALELVLSRVILDFYSPITFYFIRCIAILIISIIIFHPKLNNIDGKTRMTVLIIGAIWVIQRVIVYWGYTKLGVIHTTLIIMLGPILIYAAARIFLKEKLSWRNIIASIVILGCIAYVLFA